MAESYLYEQISVPASELRRLFNEARIVERAAHGELLHFTGYDTALSKQMCRRKNLPAGARSQTVVYQTLDHKFVALAHQYKLKDGGLGASGRPDPKTLVLGSVQYTIDHDA